MSTLELKGRSARVAIGEYGVENMGRTGGTFLVITKLVPFDSNVVSRRHHTPDILKVHIPMARLEVTAKTSPIHLL